ncbi:large subunit ribosomal protein L27e [Nematocida homosporus]|uniref:large subunit ribosomal protein L27e n=1 Tax=Nematocida homosporus TaxID=1912981 RepID=UPI00222016D2|nr:large subunit ribosomal protein L27e [Nematocida homosporus]KAI5184928.1 large subunit ribosomal protein L27e [Nematocida homosporus]
MFAKDEVVLLLKGRYAGFKGVIVEDISKVNDRNVVTVIGLEKVPKPLTEDMTEHQKKRHGSLRVFIKKMNVRHLLATRHVMENVFTSEFIIKDLTDVSERVEMKKEAEKLFRLAYENNPGHWIFKKQKI